MPAPVPQPFDWKGFWDMAGHVGTLIGLAIAGVWAYFNFVKSRTYYPRMEMAVSGELRTRGDCQYLVPRITLKNIGRSKVELNQSGSGFRIWLANGAAADTGELTWSGGKRVFPIFESHKWIEPGESVFDELSLFAIPADCIATKIQVRLAAPIGWPRRENTVWNCSTVVGPVQEKEKPQMSYKLDQVGDDPEIRGQWDRDKHQPSNQEKDDPQKREEWDRDKNPAPGQTQKG